MEYHINAKKLLVAKFAQTTFVKVPDAHFKLLSYNTTTVHGLRPVFVSNHSDPEAIHVNGILW